MIMGFKKLLPLAVLGVVALTLSRRSATTPSYIDPIAGNPLITQPTIAPTLESSTDTPLVRDPQFAGYGTNWTEWVNSFSATKEALANLFRGAGVGDYKTRELQYGAGSGESIGFITIGSMAGINLRNKLNAFMAADPAGFKAWEASKWWQY